MQNFFPIQKFFIIRAPRNNYLIGGGKGYGTRGGGGKTRKFYKGRQKKICCPEIFSIFKIPGGHYKNNNIGKLILLWKKILDRYVWKKFWKVLTNF